MRESFAEFVSGRLTSDTLLITCGLPASGKTTAAREVSRLNGYPVISTDAVRPEVLKGADVFDEKVATDMSQRLRVYDEVFHRADEAAAGGGGVIIDATFVSQTLRRRAAAIAARHGLPFTIMHTVCPDEVAIARILNRTRENCESNALTEQAYLSNKAAFEAVDLADLKRLYPNISMLHAVVDTTDDLPENWYIIEVRSE